MEHEHYLEVLAQAESPSGESYGPMGGEAPSALLEVDAETLGSGARGGVRYQAPVPAALDVVVTPEKVLVAGDEMLGFREPERRELQLLRRRLRDVACVHETHANQIVLTIHPGTEWRRVRALIREADAAGIDVVHLAFRTELRVTVPSDEDLARARGRTLADIYGSCDDVVSAIGSLPTEPRTEFLASYRRVVGNALRACSCRVDFELARAFHYQESGVTTTDGRLTVTVPMPLVDTQAAPGDQRETIAVAPELPWSRAHRVVLSALARGQRAYIAIDAEESISPTLVDATPTYHRDVCSAVLGMINDKSGLVQGFRNNERGTAGDRADDREWKTLRPRETDPDESDDDATEERVSGGLDRAIVRRYVRNSSARIRHCYSAELRHKPELHGTVVVRFQIGADGRVVNASARGLHANVAACVRDTIVGIQFPRVPDGSVVDVQYPFTFRKRD